MLERCRKYNASQEINDILAVGAGVNRRSKLSLDQLYDVTLPRNTIASVTIQDKGRNNCVHINQTQRMLLQ